MPAARHVWQQVEEGDRALLADSNVILLECPRKFRLTVFANMA